MTWILYSVFEHFKQETLNQSRINQGKLTEMKNLFIKSVRAIHEFRVIDEHHKVDNQIRIEK